MIKKVKASLHEKLIFIFLIVLGVFALGFTVVIKNKCLFVKNFDPQKINFEKPKNIAVLNAECGNVIIELYPEISPNGVERFKKLINLKAYDNVAFHRVIKDKLVQAGDLEFGKKNQLDYGKIGTGKSGFGTIKSEIDADFNFERGSVGLARTLNMILKIVSFLLFLMMKPLFEGEYTPIGKVIYGIKSIRKN
jgi:peptidyl-prolyl cis-trans isomerase A (cyclophilin A)